MYEKDFILSLNIKFILLGIYNLIKCNIIILYFVIWVKVFSIAFCTWKIQELNLSLSKIVMNLTYYQMK